MKKTTKPAAAQPLAPPAPGPGAAGRGLVWLGLLGLAVGPPAMAQAPRPGRAEAVFIKAVVSSPASYAGQALTVSYLLYHRVPLIEPDNEVKLTFKNCLVEEYPPPAQAPEGKEVLAGQVYQVALIRKYLLVPQLAGPLQIPALAQHYSFSAPPSPEDFFGEQRLVSKTIQSAALPLLVRPLPVAPDSVAFCHAVGQFQLRPTYTVSRQADNLLTVRLQLTGTGSLKNFQLPPPALPAALDVFNVRSEEQHVLTASGLRATGTYSYEVLAAHRGTYTLPGISLTYFDPAKGRYVSFAGPAFRWRVAQGPPPPTAASPAARPAGVSQGVYSKASLTESQASYLFLGSASCYGWLLLAGALFLVGLGYTYWAAAREANREHLNFKKAQRRASQALRKIERRPVVNADAYYKSLANLLITYLGDKLGLPPPALSYYELPRLLAAAEVPTPLQTQTMAYLDSLRRQRFSASKSAAPPTAFYSQELLRLIQQLDACLHYHPSPRLVAAA